MKTQKPYRGIPAFLREIFSALFIYFLLAGAYKVQCQGYFANAVGNPFGFNFTVSASDLVFHSLVDIDGDGDLDDFVSHRQYVQSCWVVTAFEFYENQSIYGHPAVFVKIPNERFGLPAQTATITFADTDQDGDQDAYISNHCFQSTFSFHRNRGTATQPQFSSIPDHSSVPAWNVGFAMVAFGDLDGDGDLDALANGIREPAVFKYLENTGTPSSPLFGNPVNNPFGLSIPLFASSEWSQFVDWDCDGDLDILNGHWQGGSHNSWLLYIHTNTGTPTAPAFGPVVSTGQYILPIALGDMDGDGDQDIFSDEYYFQNISSTGCLTAIDEKESHDVLAIFPNPVQAYLTITWAGESSLRPAALEVVNSLGEVVQRMVYPAPDFASGIQINVSSLTSGMYSVKINQDGRLGCGKFVKVE